MKYDFVEIGTSDFETLIQKASDTDIGLSIEPISYYLDKLPILPNIKKGNFAMSNVMGTVDVFYIKPDDIVKYGLPWWVRGCNSINKPHPTVYNMLGDKHDLIVTKENVPAVTWSFICETYNITEIKFLKIDTEGHDHVILEDYYNHCTTHNMLFADKIIFEYNVLANKEESNKMIKKFIDLGYVGTRPNEDDYKLEKPVHIKLFD